MKAGYKLVAMLMVVVMGTVSGYAALDGDTVAVEPASYDIAMTTQQAADYARLIAQADPTADLAPLVQAAVDANSARIMVEVAPKRWYQTWSGMSVLGMSVTGVTLVLVLLIRAVGNGGDRTTNVGRDYTNGDNLADNSVNEMTE